MEALTFDDNSIDIHITQDVMEHVFNPAQAFREIARTLKPKGAHIFTTPLTEKERPSCACAALGGDGELVHYREPEYHGNPVSSKGSLVTYRWGYDIVNFIASSCGLSTTMVYINSDKNGIEAEYIEVLVTRKP